MNWLTFKEQFYRYGCFDVNQVFAWRPNFSHDNLVRWTRCGYLLRLRRGIYAFSEYRSLSGGAYYFSGRMYRPSYISLHSALAYYGLIPEAVVQITAVTSLKTANFRNAIGEFSYKSVRQDLMFGYRPQPIGNDFFAPFATIEKALVDLLYLYPTLNTVTEMLELRLDEYILHNKVNMRVFDDYVGRIELAAVSNRAKLLREVYGL